MTVKSSPVPEVSAPLMSAMAARKPTAMAPRMVRGMMYLLSNRSRTRSSCLNPGTLSPDAMICLAWLLASMPEVWTQK